MVFAHSRQYIPRCVLIGPCVLSGGGIRLEYPGGMPLRVPREYRRVPAALVPLECPGVYPVMPCACLVAAVQAHRQAQRQVGHGFLGLPKPNGVVKLQSPENKLGKKDGGVRRVHGDVQPALNASVRYGEVLKYGMATALPGRAHWRAPDGGC